MALAKDKPVREQINRRAILKLAPVALVAGAAPALSGEILPPIAESPIAAMHREITRLDQITNASGISEEEMDAACDLMMELADRIVDIPARNTEEMFLKIMGHSVNGTHDLSNCPYGAELWAEARTFAA
ncbi:hypothetical protein ACHFJ0_05090 [Paracoccus sp. NGMCC 1.201697]|uniref:Secreted protein n=1 Tax=Paracoccus broussonetiae subsp. drimophilus TaxID=3373869 RepID=A0ABW7LH06_9RHOB